MSIKTGTKKATSIMKILDQPGSFEMIPKSLLEIDGSYQRGPKLAKQRRMANNWSWSACGSLTVSHRDGSFFVEDGQQRLGAALLRDDILALPCMVFEKTTLKEEAGSFMRINNERTQMQAYEKFRARITNEELVAIRLDALLRNHGYSISHSGRVLKSEAYVCCIALLLELMEHDQSVLERIFPLAARIASNGFIDRKIFGGLWASERFLCSQGKSLLEERYAKILSSAGVITLIQSMNGLESVKGRNLSAWSEGIIQVLNKGLRARARIQLTEMPRLNP